MNITGRNIQAFKQGQLLGILEGTYGNSAVEQQIVGSIRKGICYMLSLEWLLRLLAEPNENPGSIFSTDYGNQGTLFYYKQFANNFSKYAEDFNYTLSNQTGHPGAEKLSSIRGEDVDRHFVERCSNNSYTVNSCIEYSGAADITGTFNANCALLVSIKVLPHVQSIPGFGHKMALWRYGGQSYFFDPNIGVFLLSDFSQIMQEIVNEYTAFVQGAADWKIGITDIVKK